MINVSSVSKTYVRGNTQTEALRNVDFNVTESESCAVIGPSGCGKSTLLLLVAGLLAPTGGSITIDGEQIAGPRSDVAVVLQDFGLFPWKTVYENASLGLTLRKFPENTARNTVLAVLKELGLSAFLNHYPSQLSGGMRQRVALARVLALEPRVMLLDEPLSSLDAMTREILQNLLLEIWTERKVTMIMVTHSVEEAVFLGRRIVVISQRPGKVLSIVDNPRMGREEYRNETSFIEKCGLLRSIVKSQIVKT